MIVFIVFVVALALPAVWLFARTRPATARPDLLRRFNAAAWGVAAFAGSLAWIQLSGTSAQGVVSEVVRRAVSQVTRRGGEREAPSRPAGGSGAAGRKRR